MGLFSIFKEVAICPKSFLFYKDNSKWLYNQIKCFFFNIFDYLLVNNKQLIHILMWKYIKLFDTHDEYEAYITGSDKILPNVSYCKNINDVHYNPWTDPRVIAKFNVENVTESVMLYGADFGGIASELFSKVEIDGEQISISDLDDDGGYYTFETTGEHTVKYTLLDSEVIGEGAFFECSGLISINIPNSVTTIDGGAFFGCSGLTSMSVESGNTVYDSRNNCNAIIETATNTLLYGCQNTIIPNSVTSIGERCDKYW